MSEWVREVGHPAPFPGLDVSLEDGARLAGLPYGGFEVADGEIQVNRCPVAPVVP